MLLLCPGGGCLDDYACQGCSRPAFSFRSLARCINVPVYYITSSSRQLGLCVRYRDVHSPHLPGSASTIALTSTPNGPRPKQSLVSCQPHTLRQRKQLERSYGWSLCQSKRHCHHLLNHIWRPRHRQSHLPWMRQICVQHSQPLLLWYVGTCPRVGYPVLFQLYDSFTHSSRGAVILMSTTSMMQLQKFQCAMADRRVTAGDCCLPERREDAGVEVEVGRQWGQ